MTLQELIANSQLDKAIELLKESSTYQDDRQFQNQIIMISARLSRNRQQENMNLIPLDVAMRERNAIAHSLLGLADRYNIGDNDPPKTTIPPLIQEKDVPEGAKKILFLASDPRKVGELQMEKEYLKMSGKLSKYPAAFHLHPVFQPRADTLMETLLDEEPAIVHFSGHGVTDIEGLHPAGIVLHDINNDPYILPATALADMFKLISEDITFEVVLLNACESFDQAEAISRCGCHAIGMSKEIPDNAAIVFASGFYLRLVRKPEDIESAFKYGVQALKNAKMYSDEWAPHLYQNGNEIKVA